MDDGGGMYLALVAGTVFEMDGHGLLPGGGEVIGPREADGHPVRVPEVPDEFVRPGLVARGELQRHRLRGGSRGVLHDQQAGHHPDPGDDLHHMPTNGPGVLVRHHDGVLGVAESAGGGHAQAILPVDHGRDAVVHPQRQRPQGQQKAQKGQQHRPPLFPGGGSLLRDRLFFDSFHSLHHSTFCIRRPSPGQ